MSNASFIAKQATSGTPLAGFAEGTKFIPANTIVQADGTDAVGQSGSEAASVPGGSGILGWLSGIYDKLSKTLDTRKLLATTDSVSVGNFPAKQEVFSATQEAVSYYTGIAVVPTTLLNGTNYFWIRNPSGTKKIKIKRLEVIMVFAGTASASRSVYAIRKFINCTATTGTVTLTADPAVTTNPASIADIKWAAAGGTLTGSTISTTNKFMQIGHANQLTTNIAYDRDLSDAPIVLGQNEGIVLQADQAVVAGSTVIISLRWTEE